MKVHNLHNRYEMMDPDEDPDNDVDFQESDPGFEETDDDPETSGELEPDEEL